MRCPSEILAKFSISRGWARKSQLQRRAFPDHALLNVKTHDDPQRQDKTHCNPRSAHDGTEHSGTLERRSGGEAPSNDTLYHWSPLLRTTLNCRLCNYINLSAMEFPPESEFKNSGSEKTRTAILLSAGTNAVSIPAPTAPCARRQFGSAYWYYVSRFTNPAAFAENTANLNSRENSRDANPQPLLSLGGAPIYML